MNKSVLIILLSLLIASCLPLKPAAKKGKTNAVEVFYLGVAGNQYFVKPLAFTNKENKTILIDFTFKELAETYPKATVNYKIPAGYDEHLILKCGGEEILISETKILYLNGNNESRISGVINNNTLQKLLKQRDLVLTLTSKSSKNREIFLPTSKTKRSLHKIATSF